MSAWSRADSRWRRQALLVLYRGASDVAAKSVMFAVTVAAARQLSRDDFGLFALGTTLGWFGAVAADFGIQAHLARAVSQHPERASALLRRWLVVRLGTSAAALAVSVLLLRLLGVGAGAMPALLIFALSYAAGGLTECLFHFFRGLERSDLESTLTLGQRTVMGVLALIVLWRQPTVTRLALAMLTPSIATLVVAAYLARRVARLQDRASPAPPMHTSREFLAAVAPIGLGILLSAVYFRLDIFLIERWSGTTSVALYNAVFRLVEALRLFPAAVLAVALPTLCRAVDLRPLARLAAPLAAAGAGAAAVLWLSAGWLVPAIYGAAYGGAVLPFRTLVLALPLMALNYALTSQLIGWHGHRAYAAICAGALACNLLLNWRLIPSLGMAGAAWATLWTEAFLTLGCGVVLLRMEPTGIALVAGPVDGPLEVQ